MPNLLKTFFKCLNNTLTDIFKKLIITYKPKSTVLIVGGFYNTNNIEYTNTFCSEVKNTTGSIFGLPTPSDHLPFTCMQDSTGICHY